MPVRVLGLAATALAAVVGVAACTSAASGGGAATRPSTVRPTAGGAVPHPGRLTPSVPGVFRTGTNACGNPYAINATNSRETIPLLSCPGWADPGPHLASLQVRVGGQVLISGVPPGQTLSYDHRSLRRAGASFTALRAGRTVVTIHGHSCGPTGRVAACPLVAVSVR